MQLARIARGTIGTALAWSFAWAAVGTVTTLATVLRPDTVDAWLDAPRALLEMALGGAWQFGIFGALAGGIFALALAGSGRHLTFARLTAMRVSLLGAAGAAAIGLTIMSVRWMVLGLPSVHMIPMFAFTTLLGAGSSWAMWRIAQRGGESSSPPLPLSAPNPFEQYEPRRSSRPRSTT